MKREQYIEILTKYLDGRATAAEVNFLFAYYNLFMADADVMEILSVEEKLKLKLSIKANIDHNIDEPGVDEFAAAEAAVEEPIVLEESLVKRRTLWPRVAAAAAILLVIGAGLFFYTSYFSAPRHLDGSAATRDLLANDVKPGGNKAYLVLSNGKRLSLTDAANGELAKEAGVEITKTADGQVIYTVKAPLSPQGGSLPGGARGSVGASSDGVKYSNALNTIETPRGGQYQIRLPDGSKVWLNAASKLIYPVSFTGRGQRVVELSGEAYFEIAKVVRLSPSGRDGQSPERVPFVVKSKNQEVTVLGTHFNVNSYADEGNVKTTLLEGSVKVNQDILKPGQQSTLADGKITIKDVDVSLAIAWKNGLFAYKNAPLETVMQQIARWYDVDIEYTNPQTKLQTFSGTVSRYDNVSKILKAIEYTGSVKFKMEGRKIIAN